MGSAIASTRDLTAAQVDEVLALLVRRGGNCRGTSRELADRGIDVPWETLRDWKASTHFDRYHEIATAYARESKDKAVIQGFRELLQESQDIAADMRQRLGEHIEEIEPKDIPKAIQQLSVSMGIATEKTLLLEGRPTEIRETRNPDWYDERLKEELERLANTVNGTCEEESSEREARSGATAISPVLAQQTREPSSPPV